MKLIWTVLFIVTSSAALGETVFEIAKRFQDKIESDLNYVYRFKECYRQSFLGGNCDATGRQHPFDAYSSGQLIDVWFSANSQCRGTDSLDSCAIREAVYNYLKIVRGVCYGKNSQFPIDYEWHNCTNESY